MCHDAAANSSVHKSSRRRVRFQATHGRPGRTSPLSGTHHYRVPHVHVRVMHVRATARVAHPPKVQVRLTHRALISYAETCRRRSTFRSTFRRRLPGAQTPRQLFQLLHRRKPLQPAGNLSAHDALDNTKPQPRRRQLLELRGVNVVSRRWHRRHPRTTATVTRQVTTSAQSTQSSSSASTTTAPATSTTAPQPRRPPTTTSSTTSTGVYDSCRHHATATRTSDILRWHVTGQCTDR